MKKDLWRRAEELFHAALERPPEARRAFLDEACGGDAELRRQVELLVSKDEQAGSFLEKPALADATASPDGDIAMIGKAISHYKIIEKIGQGGMGVVYLAHDASLDRKVAVKFLPDSLKQDETARKRFVREARSAAALDHPYICSIHEVGEAEGKSFIVMEYLEGETLRDRLAQGAVPLKQAMQWAVEIAEALAVAHEKGIIHRDLKPANIMLLRTGHTKVMDFGLAKQISGTEQFGIQETTLTGLTREGTTVGTLPYMSPEQVQGKTVDLRSDLFSFGTVMYEMLTGVNPFKRDSGFDTAEAILREVPAPISKYTNPAPQQLVAFINKLLAKDPKDRYLQPREAADNLNKILDETSGQQTVNIQLAFVRMRKSLKRPVCLIPLILVLAAAVYFSVWGVKTYQKGKWAREVVPKEVERLVRISSATDNNLADSLINSEKATNVIAAFNLVRDASAALPANAELNRLWNVLSVNTKVDTEPAGAKIYAKPYDSPDEPWQFWGTSPFQGRVARIWWRCRLEKAGHEAVYAAIAPTLGLLRVLDKEGRIPSGMVRITGRKIENVQLGDYFLDRYEVTNKHYREFVRAGGYQKQLYWKHDFLENGKKLTWAEAMAFFTDSTGRPGPATWQAGDYPEGQDGFPVAGVSWYEAAAYAEFAGKSLPTIFHWAIPNSYPSTENFLPSSKIVPLSNFSSHGPLRIGSNEAINFYGIYDMAGNVREWCFNEASKGRSLRGGAWNDISYMFSSVTQADPSDRSPKNGFRCAYYPDADKIPKTAFRLGAPTVYYREYAREQPVSEEIFKVIKRQFSYDKVDLNEKTESTKETDAWIMEKISFDAAYDKERMFAYLFLPKSSKPPFQVVIFFPGSPAFLKDASVSDSLPVFDFILKNGRAVLYPIYKGTHERSEGLPFEEVIRVWLPNGSNKFRDYLIKWGKDFSRSIDYLGSRPDIDMQRIAYYGTSLGGMYAAVMPAIEPRVKASIVHLGGLFEWDKTRSEADPFNYVSRVTAPTLMLSGKYDPFFPFEISAKPMFDLLGTPSKDKFQRIYDTDHSVPRNEVIKESLWFLDRYLGLVKAVQ